MKTGLIITFIILVVLLAITIVLYFLGKKAEAKRAEQEVQIEATAQNVSMLIIDKKRMKMKDSGLPEAVIAQSPKLARMSKLPIVKAKVGPKVMTLICDEAIFDEIPVKKEVKAKVSGLYITSVRGLHGKIETQDTKKKKGLRAWALRKQKELNESK